MTLRTKKTVAGKVRGRPPKGINEPRIVAAIAIKPKRRSRSKRKAKKPVTPTLKIVRALTYAGVKGGAKHLQQIMKENGEAAPEDVANIKRSLARTRRQIVEVHVRQTSHDKADISEE